MTSQSDSMGERSVSPLSILQLDGTPSVDANVERLVFAPWEIHGVGTAASGTEDADHTESFKDQDAFHDPDADSPIQLTGERFAEEIETALQRGRAKWSEEATTTYESLLAEERAHVLKCCADFQQERARYFARVEKYVVELALEIAKRVLQREIGFNPMVLLHVVKAALAKVMEESGTILRVPAEDAQKWRDMVQGHELLTVEVRGEAMLGAGECILDTRLGQIELGVSAQIAGIEEGFADLLQQRLA